MKLLIVTQIIDTNDPVLGFFCEWVKAFAIQNKKVTVICLKKGAYDFPENVKVLSLGKESEKHPMGVFAKIKYLFRFYKYIISERKNYDAVFIHMNQIYAILGGIVWNLMNKKVGLWYAHGKVPFTLRLANLFIDKAFASTKEGYKIKTHKLQIVGQGIDTDKFFPQPPFEKYKIITVGRISPVKRIDLAIEAFAKIRQSYPMARFQIVGAAGLGEHEVYLNKLKQKVKDLSLGESVVFSGPARHDELPRLVSKAHVFVNMSNTGSLDKAIVEALSAGVPVVSSNDSFKLVLNDSSYYADTASELAQKVMNIFASDERASFRDIIVRDHSLTSLVQKITSHY